MERVKLEKLLENVKEIKSQFYVGTQEAWNTLKALERVYSTVDCVVDKINLKLNGSLKEVCCKATPERIWGVHEGLIDAMSIDDENILGFEGTDIRQLIIDSGAWRYGFDDNVHGIGISYDSNDTDIERAVDFFLPIYVRANLERVTSDSDFGSIFINLLRDDYEKIRDKVEESKISACDEYVTKFLQELSTLDW